MRQKYLFSLLVLLISATQFIFAQELSVSGKVVDRVVDKTAFGKGAQQVEISTQNYARGTYFVHLLNQDKENTVKLIK